MRECGILRNYRKANWCYKHKLEFLAKLIMRFGRIIYSADIPYTCAIGKGVVFAHNGLGVVIHDNAVIGDKCKIYQGVTIGGRNNRGFPTLEKNVVVGANALILGGITIGENATIGAGAIVINDVPQNTTMIGILAKPKPVNIEKEQE